jgi:glutamate-1-semialdehyde aminotransferase
MHKAIDDMSEQEVAQEIARRVPRLNYYDFVNAATEGDIEALKAIHTCRPDLLAISGERALDTAAHHGHLPVVSWLLDLGLSPSAVVSTTTGSGSEYSATYTRTILESAVLGYNATQNANNIAVIKELLHRGVTITQRARDMAEHLEKLQSVKELFQNPSQN